MIPFYKISPKIYQPIFISIILTITGASCKKFVTLGPPEYTINAQNVYTTDASSIAVLTGVYTAMNTPGSNFTGETGISILSGLSADELTLFDGVSSVEEMYYYYTNTLNASASGTHGAEYWSPAYNYIYSCNAAIEGLGASTSLTPSTRQQLLGESYFLRAFFYFYLTNLFGNVPLAVTSNYAVNKTLSRADQSAVYAQIISDLKNAKLLLSTSWLDGNLQPYTGASQRLRPTKWAAGALLARAYLYTAEYKDAILESDTLISNPMFSLPDLNSAFLTTSTEAIWQLQSINSAHNTEDGWTFIIPSTGPNDNYQGNPVYLSQSMLNSFEPGDLRRSDWVDSIIVAQDTFYFPYKYKSATLNAPQTEYLTALRMGEQYLIRAEAEVELGDYTDASTDLKTLRARAGLGSVQISNMKDGLDAVMHERQVELFTEWGHRWLDLKRSNTVDVVMGVATPKKANGAPWNSYQQLYPILFTDIEANRNLVQNIGY